MKAASINENEARIWLDLEAPGAFSATYGFLLRRQNRHRKHTLLASTKRFLAAYQEARESLSKITESIKSGGWISRLTRHGELRKAREACNKARGALINWVYKSIRSFIGAQTSEMLVFL